jgi:hypothetical protein
LCCSPIHGIFFLLNLLPSVNVPVSLTFNLYLLGENDNEQKVVYITATSALLDGRDA